MKAWSSGAARVDALGDHRLAMAWAVAASLVTPESGDSEVDGAGSVAVSYPGFFEELERVAVPA